MIFLVDFLLNLILQKFQETKVSEKISPATNMCQKISPATSVKRLGLFRRPAVCQT